MTSFRGGFVVLAWGSALALVGFLIHERRPAMEVKPSNLALTRVSGNRAERHCRETASVVRRYESSRHAVSNLDRLDHGGFQVANRVIPANREQGHATEHEPFPRGRHAAPAWAAVIGSKDFSPEWITHAETFHEKAVECPARSLVAVQGQASVT